MFHGKPWHFVAFFILMPVAVLLSNAMGLGTNGLFVSILVVAALVAGGAFVVKKVGGLFDSRDEAAAFLLGGPAVPVIYQPSPMQVTEEGDYDGDDSFPDGPSTVEGEVQEEMFLEDTGDTADSEDRDKRPMLQMPAHLRAENRYRLYLGSHTLDLVNAYEQMLILETFHPGTKGVTRVLAEELGRLGVPFLLVDISSGFQTLLPELPLAMLFGSPIAHHSLPAHVRRYSYPVDRERAWAAGQMVMNEGWQVVFSFSSYTSPAEASEILLSLLQGMHAWEMHNARTGEAPYPCVVIITEAFRFLPGDDRNSVAKDDPTLAQKLRVHLLAYLNARGSYGMHLYLVSRKATGMRREALRACNLWLVKQPPAVEIPTICTCTGLSPEDLMDAPAHRALLIDTVSRDSFPITMRDSLSIHEEEPLPALHQTASLPGMQPTTPTTPPLAAPATSAGATTASTSRNEREAGDGNGIEGATQAKPFSDEEIAWACSLSKTRFFTAHATKQPPVERREQARALGLRPLANGDLFTNRRANRLYRLAKGMSPAERAPYLRLAYERLHRWRLHQGAPSYGAPGEARATGPPREDRPAQAGTAAWRVPPLDGVLPRHEETLLLDEIEQDLIKDELAQTVQETLRSFRVDADVKREDISVGPTIIRLGIRPTGRPAMKQEGPGGKAVVARDGRGNIIYEARTRVKRIMELQHDLALVLEAKTIRMDAPVPGRPFVGVEIPNQNGRLVTLREVLDSEVYRAAKGKSELAIALGKDVAGLVRVGDLARMPHLLIAGATGAGKSMLINTIVASLLTQATPDDVRLLMVDPKMVELNLYNGIPHLLSPVVTEINRVVPLLKKATEEMERRYRLFSMLGVRNLDGYRKLCAQRRSEGEGTLEQIPAIVIIIDELADLMMAAPEEVEVLICRLAQLARATGIHLVIATQRPSVDVITGLIKANIPTRISFMVSSAADSRTIIDMGGAERLLGRGDMLYLPAEAGRPERIQGAFMTDEEAGALVTYWRQQLALHSKRSGPQAFPASADPGGLNGPPADPYWEVRPARETEDGVPEKGQETARQARLSEALLFEHLRAYLLHGMVCADGTPIPVRLHKLDREDQLLVAEAVTWRGHRGSAIAFENALRTKRGAALRDLLVERGLMDSVTQRPLASSERLAPLLIECGLIDAETRSRCVPAPIEGKKEQEGGEAHAAREADGDEPVPVP